MQFRRLALPLAWASVGVVGSGGCGQLLNADGIVFEAPAEGAAGNLSGIVCERGEARCEGVALQVCRDDQGGFRTARICSSPALCCDDESCGGVACRAPACAAGDYRCDGAVLSICNEDLTGWTRVDECPSAAHCNAALGRCTDQPCNSLASEFQCSGASLELCTAEGWQQQATCATPGLCTLSPSPSCANTGCGEPAAPRPFLCLNGDYFRCNDAQTGYEYVETCLNTTSCLALIDQVGGDPHQPVLEPRDLMSLGCSAPACAPGTHECRGGALYRCDPNRAAYLVLVATCQSEAHCDASQGRCTPEPCFPGAHQCSGNEYQVCRDGGWQLEERCTLAEPCVPDVGCQRGTCEAMEYRCNGAALERCNSSGTDWIPLQTCQSAALCNAPAHRCDTPVCAAGARRCNLQGQLQQCADGREAWVVERDCPALATPALPLEDPNLTGLCDSTGGGCLAQPSCTEGQLRCNGRFLERCRANAWRPQERCETAALCDPLTLQCRPPACEPGTYRCLRRGTTQPVEPGDSTLGLVLEVCTDGGDGFVVARECGSEEWCDAAHGQCDICEPEKAGCEGNRLFLCSADGQERSRDRVCETGCVAPSSGEGSAMTGQAACAEDTD